MADIWPILERVLSDTKGDFVTVPRAWLEAMRPTSAPPPAVEKKVTELLTVKQAAERIGMSESWLYHHADETGAVKRIGRALRFDAAALDKWVRQQAA